MKQPIVQMQDVSFSYSQGSNTGVDTLRDINLQVQAGEWVSIAGPNGSGKSTLVKLLNGLLSPSKGIIFVNGIKLSANTLNEIRKQIGFVFQNPDNQFIGSTVLEDIVFGLENNCLSSAEMDHRIHHYADKLNIKDLLHRHPSELSGGQKQRAAITAVLAMEPKIIIFDEATSMLDEGAKQAMIEQMQVMHTSGDYTILSITHDMDEIIASDRVIAIKEGVILANGKPIDVLQQEEIIEACRLKPPFYLQLCQELRKRQINIDIHLNERDLVNNLWQYISRT